MQESHFFLIVFHFLLSDPTNVLARVKHGIQDIAFKVCKTCLYECKYAHIV